MTFMNNERDILIPNAKFLKRIFHANQRTRAIKAICQTYGHLSYGEPDHWTEVLRAVIEGVKEYDYDEVKPFLMIGQHLIQEPSKVV